MGKRIFVLEDNDDIREIVSILLEEENYEVCAYSSIAEIRSGVALDSPADLFLLDVMVPDGNGMDYCTELKASPITAAMPVIMMSANFSKDDMYKRCKAQDYIHKPFEITDFVNRISAQIH
ncbi:response regulator transcription factor [Pedobacter sandarakinus]|uniref:response regulator transcription factor n=1 Tax=Pedobacter sandarakinus TaxID=353156 RepID=UPI002247153A|nr:response regulator [Pedobacter sandarakinus]MCX2574899.1 response regulator [Pedobacter sandarakinus]